jgi:hypothetical protein
MLARRIAVNLLCRLGLTEDLGCDVLEVQSVPE